MAEAFLLRKGGGGEKTVTATFANSNNEIISSQNVIVDQPFLPPSSANLAPDGFYFTGWNNSSYLTGIDTDTTFTPSFSQIVQPPSGPTQTTTTRQLDGGFTYTNQSVTYNYPSGFTRETMDVIEAYRLWRWVDFGPTTTLQAGTQNSFTTYYNGSFSGGQGDVANYVLNLKNSSSRSGSTSTKMNLLQSQARYIFYMRWVYTQNLQPDYNLTFINFFGEVVDFQTVPYDGNGTLPVGQNIVLGETTLVFERWSDTNVTNVLENKFIYAIYTPQN